MTDHLDFQKLKAHVALQFNKLAKGELFRTQVSKDEVWDTYLASFPAGTNPMYRSRTEYDCSCCKQFVRAVGNVVGIVDGKLVSIWDGQIADPSFQIILNALSAKVKSFPIDNKFFHIEKTAGTDKTFEQLVDRKVQAWNHFFVNIPTNFVCKKADIGPKLSDFQGSYDVMARSLKELTMDSVDTILELIAQNSLYRGAEHTYTLQEFKKLKTKYLRLDEADKPAFVWSTIGTVSPSVSRVRNTSIGTLLTNLSEGMELENAVKAFEAMVAPANYKRPTALVTKAMIERAKQTIVDLGLTSALDRRYATLADLTVNNILFVDRTVAGKIADTDVFGEIAATVATTTKVFDKVETISIDKFLESVVPSATSIEVFLDNKSNSNFVSLITAADATAAPLFKWDNNFSWSYNGDMTDAIKERVKQAGGSLEGDLCCRLSWSNFDDLDLRMEEPDGNVVYFGNRGTPSRSGGILDVDMNAGSGTTRTPVENIVYSSKSKMKEGVYTLIVNQYCARDTTDIGFDVQIDIEGTIYTFSHDKKMTSGVNVTVAKILYTKAGGLKIQTSLPASTSIKEVWNLKTQGFHKVDVLCASPNYWDDRGVGNKHYFFMLNGCQNDGTARGFFNEFLKSELDAHRKVIEIVGSKMRTDECKEQLSGLGFSSTQRNEVICRVTGKFSRVVKVQF